MRSIEAINHERYESVKKAVNYNSESIKLLDDLLIKRQSFAKALIKDSDNLALNKAFDYCTLDIIRLLGANYMTESES